VHRKLALEGQWDLGGRGGRASQKVRVKRGHGLKNKISMVIFFASTVVQKFFQNAKNFLGEPCPWTPLLY